MFVCFFRDFLYAEINLLYQTKKILLRGFDLHSHNPHHHSELGLVLDSTKLAARSGRTRNYDSPRSDDVDLRNSSLDAEGQLCESDRLVPLRFLSVRIRRLGRIPEFYFCEVASEEVDAKGNDHSTKGQRSKGRPRRLSTFSG